MNWRSAVQTTAIVALGLTAVLTLAVAVRVLLLLLA